MLFDFGLVSGAAWAYGALGILVISVAGVILSQTRHSDGALGLGLVILAWGHDIGIRVLYEAVNSTTGLISLWWLGNLVGIGLWLVGYIVLIGAVPAGWNRVLRRLSFRVVASIATLWLVAANALIYLKNSEATIDDAGRPMIAYMGDSSTAILTIMNTAMTSWTMVLMLVAIVVAVGAYRRAETPLAKRSARAYLIGLVPADAYFALTGVLAFLNSVGVTALDSWWVVMPSVLPFGIWLVFWVGYAVFSTKIFDIDLRIKKTISRGTVVSIFVAVFLVVNILIENYLQEKMGLVGGAVAAGTLLFGLNRLQTLGTNVADKVMPKTVATPAYEAYRKIEVYREAAREVLEDGMVTDRERSLLRRLQDQLGLDDGSIQAVESEIVPQASAA